MCNSFYIRCQSVTQSCLSFFCLNVFCFCHLCTHLFDSLYTHLCTYLKIWYLDHTEPSKVSHFSFGLFIFILNVLKYSTQSTKEDHKMDKNAPTTEKCYCNPFLILMTLVENRLQDKLLWSGRQYNKILHKKCNSSFCLKAQLTYVWAWLHRSPSCSF